MQGSPREVANAGCGFRKLFPGQGLRKVFDLVGQAIDADLDARRVLGFDISQKGYPMGHLLGLDMDYIYKCISEWLEMKLF